LCSRLNFTRADRVKEQIERPGVEIEMASEELDV
jgi:hypothetical protein